jgi:hypothetical protein
MKKRLRPAFLIVALTTLWAASLPAFGLPSAKYEEAPRLPGQDLVAASLLNGPLHGVAEPVAVENFFGRFEIDSKFGIFRVAGADLLAVRVRELAAIDALGEVNRSEAFQQALSRSAQVPIQFVGNAFTDPTATVESVTTGFGTVLGRAGRLATVSARAVGDTASDMTSRGARTQAPPQPDDEPLPPAFTGDPFGFNKARREWAKELGIDPYTTNPVLRARLDDAARATFAGNFAINASIGLVAAPLQYAATFDTVVRDSVWNTPVIDLVAQNEQKLRAMGIAGRPVRDFFRNRWFTPSLQTALVLALEQMTDVSGRESVIESATAVRGEARARSLIGAVRLLTDYHRDATRLTKIRMAGIAAIGSTAGRDLVVAADVDYLWWNAEAADFAGRPDLKAKRHTLLVSGRASALASEELARARWDVRTGLRPDPTK